MPAAGIANLYADEMGCILGRQTFELSLEHFHFWSIYSENGVRYQKCEAPEGPFRLLVPDPVFRADVVPKNALVREERAIFFSVKKG
jgi:hypothetical protein